MKTILLTAGIIVGSGVLGFALALVLAFVTGEIQAWQQRREYERNRPHYNEQCWCDPILYYTSPGGNQVWLHRDLEDAWPPADVLAEAIIFANLDDEEE